MKRSVRFLIVLLIICTFSAGGVGTIFYLLAGRIEENKQAVKDEAVRFVLPEAVTFDTQKYAGDRVEESVIVGIDESGDAVGYAAIGVEKGYSSDIEILVGVRSDLESIIAVKILSQSETPGLGAKVDEIKSDKTIWSAVADIFSAKDLVEGKSLEEPWFQEQFKGKTLEQLEVVKVKGPDKIQAITAATISSKAATKAVRIAMERITKVVREDRGGAEGGY